MTRKARIPPPKLPRGAPSPSRMAAMQEDANEAHQRTSVGYVNAWMIPWKIASTGRPRYVVREQWNSDEPSTRGRPRREVVSVAANVRGDFDRHIPTTKFDAWLNARVESIAGRDALLVARIETHLDVVDHTILRELGLDPEHASPEEVYHLTGEYPQVTAELERVEAVVPVRPESLVGDVIRLVDGGWKVLMPITAEMFEHDTGSEDRSHFYATYYAALGEHAPPVLPERVPATKRALAIIRKYMEPAGTLTRFWNDPPRKPAEVSPPAADVRLEEEAAQFIEQDQMIRDEMGEDEA